MKLSKWQMIVLGVVSAFVLVLGLRYLYRQYFAEAHFAITNKSARVIQSLQVKACKNVFKFQKVAAGAAVEGKFKLSCDVRYDISVVFEDGGVLQDILEYSDSAGAQDQIEIGENEIRLGSRLDESL